MLQASLGGSASAFSPVSLGDRVFKFQVADKKVRFFIYNLKSYECDQFKIFFHLWSDGGPRSEDESRRWEQEIEAE